MRPSNRERISSAKGVNLLDSSGADKVGALVLNLDETIPESISTDALPSNEEGGEQEICSETGRMTNSQRFDRANQPVTYHLLNKGKYAN